MRGLSGILLMAIGVLHTIVGISFGRHRLVEVWRDGVFNSIEPHLPRMFLFWFLLVGLLAMMFGHALFWVERRLGRCVPAFVGWEFLALAALAGVLNPDPGGLLLGGLGVLVIRRARGEGGVE